MFLSQNLGPRLELTQGLKLKPKLEQNQVHAKLLKADDNYMQRELLIKEMEELLKTGGCNE